MQRSAGNRSRPFTPSRATSFGPFHRATRDRKSATFLNPVKLRLSLLAAGAVLAGITARATVDDALSFALEAMTPYIKDGYTIREDTWGGDLPVATAKAISQQLFKGNDYW